MKFQLISAAEVSTNVPKTQSEAEYEFLESRYKNFIVQTDEIRQAGEGKYRWQSVYDWATQQEKESGVVKFRRARTEIATEKVAVFLAWHYIFAS